jgi:hypothetical protein
VGSSKSSRTCGPELCEFGRRLWLPNVFHKVVNLGLQGFGNAPLGTKPAGWAVLEIAIFLSQMMVS